MNEVLNSVNYIDTINKLDNLINDLLYSQESGYINMLSIDAIKNAQDIIDKFNYESDRIIKESTLSNCVHLVENKKNELVEIVKEHYEKQIFVWAWEVFNQGIDNLLLKLSANKNNIDNIRKIFFNSHCLVNWISEIGKLSKEDRLAVLKETDLKIKNILASADENYIQKNSPDVSNEDIFMELFNLISFDIEKFMTLDLNNYKFQLTNSDIIYFQNLQNKLRINKTSVFDEISLLNYALKILNSKENSDKYKFIKEVIDDFSSNKDASFENKVSIVKRRYELFKDRENYYRKLFG